MSDSLKTFTSEEEPIHPDFLNLPWAKAVLQNPDLIREPLIYNIPAPNDPPHHFSLFNQTLKSPETIRSHLIFRRRPETMPRPTSPPSTSSFPASTTSTFVANPDHPPAEYHFLYSLGTGLCGPRGLVHGGVLMTLADGAMAISAMRVARERRTVDPRTGSVLTASLACRFRRIAPAPLVVRVRVVVEGQDAEGNLFLAAVIDEGDGGKEGKEEKTKRPFLEAEAKFVPIREKKDRAKQARL